MRIIREVEIDTNIALTLTYDIEALGIKGVIVQIAEDGAGNLTISELSVSNAAVVKLLLMAGAGTGTSSEMCRFGMPLCGQSVTFAWPGGGTRRGRLVFVDEPIAPWGRVVLRKGIALLTPLQSQLQFAFLEFGSFARQQLIVSSTRACHVNFDVTYRDLTISMASHIVIAGAAGGYQLGVEMPGTMGGALTLVNDDAALNNTISYALIAVLG